MTIIDKLKCLQLFSSIYWFIFVAFTEKAKRNFWLIVNVLLLNLQFKQSMISLMLFVFQ